MNKLSLTRVIVRRIADDWKLLLTVFIGIFIATTIGAGTPIYLESLDQLSFNAALDRIDEPKIDVFGAEIVATDRSVERAERVVTDAVEEHIADVYDSHERFIKSRVAIIGTPDIPLPEGTGEGIYVSRGYLQHLSNLPDHVQVRRGANGIRHHRQFPVWRTHRGRRFLRNGRALQARNRPSGHTFHRSPQSESRIYRRQRGSGRQRTCRIPRLYPGSHTCRTSGHRHRHRRHLQPPRPGRSDVGPGRRSAQSPGHRDSRPIPDGAETGGKPLGPLRRRDGHALRPAGPRRGDHLPRPRDVHKGRADAGRYPDQPPAHQYGAGNYRPARLPRVALERPGPHRVRSGGHGGDRHYTGTAWSHNRWDRPKGSFLANADQDRGRVQLLAGTWPARNYHGADCRLL